MRKNIIKEKSFRFALEIIDLYKKMNANREYILSKQLLKSGTSIGANIEEAGAAQTKKDFIAKMSIASKEARETSYWLRLIECSEIIQWDLSPMKSEINEIINILTSIVKTAQNNINKK